MQIKEFSLCARARVCVDGGGSPHRPKQTVKEIQKTFLGWGGILSPQLILQRGPMIFSKKTNL